MDLSISATLALAAEDDANRAAAAVVVDNVASTALLEESGLKSVAGLNFVIDVDFGLRMFWIDDDDNDDNSGEYLDSSISDDGSSGEGFRSGPSCLVALRANEDRNFECRIAPFLNKNGVFRLCILLPLHLV